MSDKSPLKYKPFQPAFRCKPVVKALPRIMTPADRPGRYGGQCGRLTCESVPAVLYNRLTCQYVCAPCGHKMNQLKYPGENPNSHGVMICVGVDQPVGKSGTTPSDFEPRWFNEGHDKHA